ncbi:XRE family transcriptional regulator [Microbacterium sp. C5A9]|nr:XRE family transcriptional regulator [Microbacterium sp. C5A9]
MIAQAVKRELAHAGATAASVSERSGIAVEKLTAQLSCRRDFTITDLAAIAQVLGIPVSRLVPPPSDR